MPVGIIEPCVLCHVVFLSPATLTHHSTAGHWPTLVRAMSFRPLSVRQRRHRSAHEIFAAPSYPAGSWP